MNHALVLLTKTADILFIIAGCLWRHSLFMEVIFKKNHHNFF